jgi:hypothetical protein
MLGSISRLLRLPDGSGGSVKKILFGLSCLLAFLLAAAISCTLRAKFKSVPELKASYARMYAANLGHYSFLQYNQAGSDQGKDALLEYIELLQRIRAEGIQFPPNLLRYDFGLAYLRLYRLELAAGDSASADRSMQSAQKELSGLGWKQEDLSAEALAKQIQTRESGEAKLYNTPSQEESAVHAETGERKGKSE